MLCAKLRQLLELSQPTISHHAGALFAADFTEVGKQGRHPGVRLNVIAQQFSYPLQMYSLQAVQP
ncbi:MAG: hypothetical protein ABDH31_01660 [Chlorobiota bacterium]